MQCQEASEMMSLRMDGLLSPAQSQALTAHVASCAACAQEQLCLERVAALFAEPTMASPPAGLQLRIMESVERHHTRSRLGRGFGLALLVVFVIAGLAALSLMGVWSIAIGQTSVAHALVLVLTRTLETVRTVLRAVGLMATSMLGGPAGLIAIGSLVVTGVLMVQWVRMLVRPMAMAEMEAGQ